MLHNLKPQLQPNDAARLVTYMFAANSLSTGIERKKKKVNKEYQQYCIADSPCRPCLTDNY